MTFVHIGEQKQGISRNSAKPSLRSKRVQADPGNHSAYELVPPVGLPPTNRHPALTPHNPFAGEFAVQEPHEPQIPQQTDCVVLVLDGGLWGEVLQAEQVHRPNGCLDLLGHVWNAEKAWRYFLRSPVFAPQYGQMSWVILLNSPGLSADNKEPVCIKDALLALCHRWAEIQPDFDDLTKFRSKHLRIAAGDAKEGILQWFDLW